MGTTTQKAPIAKLGETGIYILVDLGRMALFLLKTLRGMFRRPFRFSELVKQINFIGAGSILVIFFTAASTVMVLGLQGYYSLHKFGPLIYLALNLGEVPFITQSSTYVINAEFDNVSGVKEGASVQVAGVVVRSVSDIRLSEDDIAQLSLRIARDLKVPLDSIASVKSQGIIGDKYVQISLGGDQENFEENGIIFDTESAVDIESLISKFAFGSAK